MPRTTAPERRAQIELIAKKLTAGFTDTDVMNVLKIKRATFYNYKAKIFEIWGDLSAKKTEQSVQFEAELLKDKLIRLHRLLEMRIIEAKDESLADIAEACSIDAQLAIATFKLEFEGLRTRQLRGIVPIESKAIGRLGSWGDAKSELSEPDFAPGKEDDEASNEPSDEQRSGDTEEKVY